MKIPSNDLFSIIKSLDRHEKRNFKLFVQNTSDSAAYIKLFDVMDALEFYDEKKVVAVLERKNWDHELKHVKRYLQESILQFLEYYYADHSVEIQLQRYLQRIEIFCAKKLFTLARQMIKKVKDLAEKSYQYYYLLIILSKEDEIINLELDIKAMNNHAMNNHPEKMKCMEILANIMDYDKLVFQVSSILKRELFVSENKRIEVEAFLNIPLLKEEAIAISIPAKLKRYAILGQLFLSLRNFELSYLNYKKAVELLKKHAFIQQSNIAFYMDTMNYFIIAAVLLKKNKEVFVLFNDVKSFMDKLPKKLQSVRVLQKYLIISDNHIDFLLRIFKVEEAKLLSEQISTSIKKYSGIDNYLVFHNNCCLVYFHLGDYRKALQNINVSLNAPDSGIRTDMIIFAKIMNLIVHYELGNEELLPGLCKSTYRYMEKKWHVDRLEETLLNFFGKTIHRFTIPEERTIAFQELRKELAQALSKQVFQDFDLLAWVDSKIMNRPFLEAAKERANESRRDR
jgi:uncharacterized protein YcgL (UPF0745 family)